MKAVFQLSVLLLLASLLQAQTAAPRKKATKPVNSDVQALKEAVAAQQEQIQALSQQLQQTNSQLQQTNQQFQQTQQQLQQAQQAAADAEQKANALAASSVSKDAVDKLGLQFADVQTTLSRSVSPDSKMLSGVFAGRATFVCAARAIFRNTADARSVTIATALESASVSDSKGS